MSYKVTYKTLAVLPDGSVGNLIQGGGVIFTDIPIHSIPNALAEHLGSLKKPMVPIIKEIVDVGGKCLFDAMQPNTTA